MVAVVDTNVLLDVFSCHNLIRLYDELGEGVVDHPRAVFRRARARESILLCLHFHTARAHTFSHGHELITLLKSYVDPHTDEAFETPFTKMVANFVNDRLWSGWQSSQSDPLTLEAGNDVDQALVNFAAERRLPLITNEGFTPDGYEEGKIAKRAKAKGVAVKFPKDVYRGMDEEVAITDFLDRFVALAPNFIKERQRPDLVEDALQNVYRYYRHVLLGESSLGRLVKVRV